MRLFITNPTRGRQQVRTLSHSLVYLAPNEEITADVESSYGRLLMKSRVLDVREAYGEELSPQIAGTAGNLAAGGQEGTEGGNDAENDKKAAGEAENGTSGEAPPPSEPQTKAEWAAHAEGLGITVKSSWTVAMIKKAVAEKESA